MLGSARLPMCELQLASECPIWRLLQNARTGCLVLTTT